jgi:hypothetical protein
MPPVNSSTAVAQVGSNSKWAAAYGWLMIVSGLCLFFAGIIGFSTARVTVPSAAVATAKPIGMIFAVALGLLCAVTGIILVARNRTAARRP